MAFASGKGLAQVTLSTHVAAGDGPLRTLKTWARSRLSAMLNPSEGRFRGAFPTYAEAMAAVRPGRSAGYDNDDVVEVSFEQMCELHLRDYAILFWLDRLTPHTNRLLDAGGHMGTKYRAFRSHLNLPSDFEWVIYDVPAIVRAGRARAEREGLSRLSFYDRLEELPPSDLLLASGLLQYLDIPFATMIERLRQRPRHLLLNKVATREGPTVVTLEDFGTAETPYQVRNRAEFLATLDQLGYDIVDQWVIPSLSREHPAFGKSTSRGFYARLRQ